MGGYRVGSWEDEKNWENCLRMLNFIKVVSERDKRFPVQIISKGENKDIQCRKEGQLSVNEEEGIFV